MVNNLTISVTHMTISTNMLGIVYLLSIILRMWPRIFYEHTLYSLRPPSVTGVVIVLLLIENRL